MLTRTWKARCQYTEYQCSGALRDTHIPFVVDAVGTSCTAIGSARTLRTVTPPLPPPVDRGEDQQKRRTLTSIIRQGAFHFVLYGVPALNADAITMYIELPPELAGKPCAVGFVADDEPVSSRFEVRAVKADRLKVRVEVGSLRMMARASSTTGSICGRDWTLHEAAQRTLRAFLTDFANELAMQEVRTGNSAARASDARSLTTDGEP